MLTAPTLVAIPTQTLQSGMPLQVPINATSPSGFTLSYSVTSTNPAITADLQTSNPYLVMNISHTASTQPGDTSFSGQIVIELFPSAAPTTVAQIENLVDAGDYNSTTFYRIAEDFVIQGGFGSSAMPASSHAVNNEFDSVLPLADPSQPLEYTSVGVVGLARTSADNTGSTEFFIQTAASAGNEEALDNEYTIFGQVVSGMTVVNDIANVPNNPSAGPSGNQPYSPVTITSASITTDNLDFALGLSAPFGTTGSSTITVTANDGNGGTTSQSFQVNLEPPLSDPPPVIQSVTPPSVSVNKASSFTLPISDLENDPVTIANDSAAIPGLTVSVNSTTHVVTLTPTSGLTPGVDTLTFSVSSSATSFAQADELPIPLFVDPAAPTSVSLDPASETGGTPNVTSLNNSSTGQELTFDVGGVTSGDTVLLFDGSTQIGSAVATGSTVKVTTTGAFTLSNGVQNITAEQVKENVSYAVGNTSGTTSLASLASSPGAVTIDTTPPVFTSTPVTAAPAFVQYTYTATVSDIVSTGVKYSLVSGPSGLTVSSGGVVSWVPTNAQVGGNAVEIRATDAAGNSSTQSFNITVSHTNAITDLAVSLAASSTTLPGGGIGYTVTVTNNGPSPAESVLLSDVLPATVIFGTQTQNSGPAFTLSHSGNTITDTVASMAAGASASFTIAVDLPTSAAAGTISDTATVSSTTPESNSANNSATVNTTVNTTGVMMTTDPITPTENDLVVGGTAGADNVSFAYAGAGKVSVTMDGKSYGTFAVTGRIIAYAGAGNDEIVVSSAITLPTFLYAGSGADELVGGSGNNVLVGGTGADTLIGGTGHNILIAGTGPSKLYSTPLGVAASINGGSIMIAGSTSYDHNETALATIMAEWASSDSYATRVAKISNGSLSGGVALSTSTITASRAVDELFASTGYDWFWTLSPMDQILNLSPQKKASLIIN